MKKQLLAAVLLSSVVLASPAFADDSVTTKSESTYTPSSNGGFESKDTMEHTNAQGTTTSRKSDEKVDVDSKGNKETKVDIQTTTDPKGLFNKSTTKIENKAVEKDGKTEYKHKKTIDGKVIEENDQEKNSVDQ